MEEKQSVAIEIPAEPGRLEVVIWDDPRLSQICDKVEDNEFGPKLESFGRQLVATMNAKNGIGLAAPQVGVLKRMFVMLFPDHEELEAKVICNPVLCLEGAAKQDREGCLSLPGIFEHVSRAERVTMQYQDPLGKNYEMLLITPLDARVAQHEFDHLNGIMFFDYKDKRDVYGARMSKQVGKNVLRMWEKEKKKRGY